MPHSTEGWQPASYDALTATHYGQVYKSGPDWKVTVRPLSEAWNAKPCNDTEALYDTLGDAVDAADVVLGEHPEWVPSRYNNHEGATERGTVFRWHNATGWAAIVLIDVGDAYPVQHFLGRSFESAGAAMDAVDLYLAVSHV